MTTAQQLIQDINGLLQPGSGITALTHQDVEARIVNFAASQWLKGDIKEVVCDNNYVSTNFTTAGLGRFEREGWAIMNGATHVYEGVSVTLPSDAGKVIIASGGGYVFGQTGGEENVTLTENQIPSHTHAQDGYNLVQNTGGTLPWYNWGSSTKAVNSTVTGPKGGGQSHTNMQPFVVRLRIMKL